ncbi:MAG: hypothetical protein ACR2RB_14110, partial [Gammaproteobacteria bacterium]
MAEVSTEMIWPIVIDRLSPGRLEEAVRSRRIPHAALADIAALEIHEGDPGRAVELLEPIFAGDVKRLDERSALAFSLLCDAYDDLGQKRKKNEFIDRLTQVGSSELQSEAWQRKAVVSMDQGKRKVAWEAHRRAQRLTPRDPGIGFLEVNLLMGEGRIDEARDAGKIWLKRLERDGVDPDDPMIEFFRNIAADPGATFSDISLEQAAPGAHELQNLLAGIEQRPLPVYSVGELELAHAPTADTVRTDLVERLALMGLPQNNIDGAVADIVESLMAETDIANDRPNPLIDIETGPHDDLQDEDNATPVFALRPPEKAGEIEAAWQDVWPLGKPFSVAPVPLDCDDPWDPELFAGWFELLVSNPEAFDSLTILDDLVIAIELIEEGAWVDRALALPILNRAAAIISMALADAPDTAQLPWIAPHNRAALRLLVKRALTLERDDDPESINTLRLVLKLNPHDN